MPKFSNAGIARVIQLIGETKNWINQLYPYTSPGMMEYLPQRQSQSVIIEVSSGSTTDPALGSVCPLANESTIRGNAQLNNVSFSLIKELDALIPLLKEEMREIDVVRVNAVFASFVSWAESVINYLKQPIPNIHIPTGKVLESRSLNIANVELNPFYYKCGIIPPATLIGDGELLIEDSRYVLETSNGIRPPSTNPNTPPPATDFTPLPEPVDTVMAPITVPENGASRLFNLMERLYGKINNEHYIIITRITQTKAELATLYEYIDLTLVTARMTNLNVLDNRTETKEARQGIKDLLGLGEKFYPGSVSTIELLERMNVIHQSENDVLYEIRVRCQEIKSYVEEIRADTLDIDVKLEALKTQIQENFTQTNQYINQVIAALETNILARIEQMRQEQYQQTLAIIETINRIDTSVGT